MPRKMTGKKVINYRNHLIKPARAPKATSYFLLRAFREHEREKSGARYFEEI